MRVGQGIVDCFERLPQKNPIYSFPILPSYRSLGSLRTLYSGRRGVAPKRCGLYTYSPQDARVISLIRKLCLRDTAMTPHNQGRVNLYSPPWLLSPVLTPPPLA